MSGSGSVFVVSGPSGAWKSTLIRTVRESLSALAYSVSHTSRNPRGTEANGVDYHFVSRETFEQMIERGEFAEWAEVYKDCYGTSISSLEGPTSRGLDVIMDVDVQGASNIKARLKESILVYVLPPSLGELAARLRNRGTESEEAVRNRLEKAVEEIRNCLWYDYLIFNDDVADAAEHLKSVIIAQRCRLPRQLPKAAKIFALGSKP